jgi:cytoskeletal protein CcmA (bactofilin family)
MLQVKAKLQEDYGDASSAPAGEALAVDQSGTDTGEPRPHSVPESPLVGIPTPPRKSDQPIFPTIHPAQSQDFQTRLPAIIGEATFRGSIPVDGVIVGQLGGSGGTLTMRQRGRPFFGAEPELSGDICFRDMLRVNGRIAGTVQSKKGTLIVDLSARVDADVDVSIAVIAGTVHGDIVAQQRVEVASTAKIYGNIWTRSLAIQRGAIFEGVCQMLEGKADG